MTYYEPVCNGCGQGLKKVKQLTARNGNQYCPSCYARKFGTERMTQDAKRRAMEQGWG